MATTLDYVKAQLPDYADTYVKDMLSQTQAVTDINANPYQQYPGERVAGFSGLQQQAFQGAEGMQPSAYTGQGAGIAGLAAQQALGAGQNFQPGQFQGGQFGSQEAQQYMNPYMQNVVDVQQREAQRQADVAGAQRNAQAVGSGAFGGSRQAITDAEASRNLATQKGDIQAQGLNTAYTNAQQQFNADQARRMSAESLGEQSRQMGASLGLQGANTALQGASTLGTLGNQQFGQQKDISGLQYLYGTTQQANQQQQNDVGFQNFQAAQNYPKEQLAFRSSMLNALPMGGSVGQTTTQDQPNYMNTILGGGLKLLGMAAGGAVTAMAAGGSVPSAKNFSMLSDPQLQQALQAAKRSGDTPTFMALMAESTRRAQTRTAGMGQQSAPPPNTVADQVMTGTGIATLPSGDHNYADGGIVAFNDGGLTLAEKQLARGKAAAKYQQDLLDQAEKVRQSDAYTEGDRAKILGHIKSMLGWEPQDQNTGTLERRYPSTGAPAPLAVAAPTQAAPAAVAPAAAPAGIATLRQPPVSTPAPRSAAPARASVAPAPATAVTPTAPTAAAPQTYEEYRRDIRKGAEEDNADYEKMNAAAKARDAARREELSAPRDKLKEFMSAAGTSLMGSDKPYVDLGRGMSAGFAGIEKESEIRKAKLALLDDAEEKRQLAALADQRGNRAAAGLYRKQYEELIDKAKALEGQAETRAETKRANLADEKEKMADRLQRGDIARTRVAGIAGLSKSTLPVLKQQAADIRAQLVAHEKVAPAMADQQQAAAIKAELQDRQHAIDEAIAKLPGAATIGTPGTSPGGIKFVGALPTK